MKKNIPNIITSLRILLTIISFVVIIEKNYILGIILLISAALTDFFDGYLARKLKAQSILGAKLDQLSDKLFTFLSATALIISGNKYLIVLIIIEFIFSIIVSYKSYKINCWKESTKIGKFKTPFIFVTIVMGLIFLIDESMFIPFLIIWGITTIIQLYANTTIVINFDKNIKKIDMLKKDTK
ncbi:MAG: CDP-alcohol phosphatidyltransferase family protein [Bacilli bacterium]|nr:CDP-alcohol phosphatidyltransferase family protein [Bacilli bacterium]MDD3995921.1 CDP-alcohol phosphatidyltransferase family protein [Bacilli bacterium]MDD4623820.1 CDP-alcohol phosphatidyltransferase family protein [Bacilli bacterium]